MKPIAVLGSGMAGWGASSRLRAEGVPHIVFDMNGWFGGHTFSHADPQGFVFDEGPHISFTKDSRVQQLLADNVRGEYEVIRARVNNDWQGVRLKHPAQCNLYGLPTDLIVRIITDMVEARQLPAAPVNYAEWLVAGYGRTFAEQFPMRYGHKYHTTEAANMSLDWLGPRLYQPKIEEVLAGALAPETPDVHYVQEFRYPSRGGFVSYLKPFAQGMDLRLDHRLVQLDDRARTLTFANGERVGFEDVISSVPLPELIKLMPHAPPDVRAAAARLACTTCVVVNVGVKREDLSDWHWTYFYDEDVCFSRVSFPHLFSPQNVPSGMGSIQVEVYFSSKYKPLNTPPESSIAPVLRDLRRCRVLRDDDEVVSTSVIPVTYANVIFDLDRASALAIVHGYLADADVHFCGRYGEWGYQWTDESFLSGERAAQQVLDAMTTRAR